MIKYYYYKTSGVLILTIHYACINCIEKSIKYTIFNVIVKKFHERFKRQSPTLS